MRRIPCSNLPLLLSVCVVACDAEPDPEPGGVDREAVEALMQEDAQSPPAADDVLAPETTELLRELAEIDPAAPDASATLKRIQSQLEADSAVPPAAVLEFTAANTPQLDEIDPYCAAAYIQAAAAGAVASTARMNALFNYIYHNPYNAYGCYFDTTVVYLDSGEVTDWVEGADFSLYTKNGALQLIGAILTQTENATYSCAVTALSGLTYAVRAWEHSELTEDLYLSSRTNLHQCTPASENF